MSRIFKSFRRVCISCVLLAALAVPAADKVVSADGKILDEALGLVRKNNFDDAQKLIEHLVKKQDPEALTLQGLIELKRKNSSLAAELFQKAADLGNCAAKLHLAVMFKEANGVKQDLPRAFKLFKEVADISHDTKTCFNTAIMLINGEGVDVDVDAAEKYLIIAAEMADENAADADTDAKAQAQLLLGLIYKEKAEQDSSFYNKMYHYLELSAANNNADAWYNLGVNYYVGCGLENADMERSRLCFLAAERLEPAARTEYNLGIVYWKLYGNRDESFRWMKLAAEKGDAQAKLFMSKPPEFRKVPEQKIPDVLTDTVNSHFDRLRQALAESGSGEAEKVNAENKKCCGRMILLPMENIPELDGWDFDFSAHHRKIAENVTADRQGNMRWMTDEYKSQPLEENLLYINPTIRQINQLHEDAMLKALNASKFKVCTPQETEALRKQLFPESDPEELKCNFWKLRKDLYFCLQADFSGRWQMRYYQFIIFDEKGKPEVFLSFRTPPDKVTAALINGILQGNPAAMNNFAVLGFNGELSGEHSDEDEVELLLCAATEAGIAASAYNTAVFYQSGGKTQLAAKYFERAQELAGSSVISYLVHRPEICDRNGNLLVKNDITRSGKATSRVFVQDGKFAAALIGHTSMHGKDNVFEEGMRSMERIIDMKNIRRKVYLTIDTALQTQLEKLVENIFVQSAPQYVHAIAVSSSGELLGMAQRPVFDLKKRKFAEDDGWKRGGVQAIEYVFPVPDEWMKLLGSASAALPTDKEKFQFHRKLGVFPVEAQGVVLGLNRMQNKKDPAETAGQMTPTMNYLLAYIAHAENKPIPRLSIYQTVINTPLTAAGGVKWISFYRPFDGIVVNALGVAESSKSGEKIYILVRSVHAERNFKTPPLPETVKKASDGADKAEKIIRQWSISGK